MSRYRSYPSFGEEYDREADIENQMHRAEEDMANREAEDRYERRMQMKCARRWCGHRRQDHFEDSILGHRCAHGCECSGFVEPAPDDEGENDV